MILNEKETQRLSKFLSLVLRHQPETIGIALDDAGWTSVEGLLIAMRTKGHSITREILDHVVATNDKQRFAYSEDGGMIRARQGHSIEVELGYESAQPPEFLLHCTPAASVESIRRGGLKKMKRHHVHLHSDESTAMSVGARRGTPVTLRISAQIMASEGFEFFVTANGVWLTDHVPARFIEFPSNSSVGV